MPLFIAKNHEGKVIDVVLAKIIELANAYWHGKEIIPHTVNSKSDADLEGHPTGVLPIVSTYEQSVRNFYSGSGFIDVLLIE